jgi:hypothetical protein
VTMPLRTVHKAPCGHCLGPGPVGRARDGGVYSRLFPTSNRLSVDPRPDRGPGAARRGLRRRPRGARVRRRGRLAVLRPARRARHHRGPLAARSLAARRPRELPRAAAELGMSLRGRPHGQPLPLRPHRPGEVPPGRPRRRPSSQRAGTALIGDPRDDSHLVVSQMHVALLRAHNRIVDRLRSRAPPRTNSSRTRGAF